MKICNRFKSNFDFLNKREKVFLIICLVLVVYRATLHADINDEIVNLNVAYRIATGDKPFFDIWESFQTGDFLLALVLVPYIHIIGTGGIVLYSRAVFILFLFLTSWICYMILRKTISNKAAFLIGFVCMTFQLHGMYYLWCDTAAVIFLTIGCLFLYLFSLQREQKKSTRFLYIAGICHGVMALSYPATVFLAIFTAFVLFDVIFKENGIKYSLQKTSFYCIGGATILVVVSLYLLFFVGIEETVWGIQNMLSIRTLSAGGSSMLSGLLNVYIIINENLIIPTLILFLLFFKSINNKKWLLYLCIGIVIFPAYNLIVMDDKYRGLFNYLSYIALWGPFLYYLLPQKHMKFKNMLILIWLPSIISSLCVASSQVPLDIGPQKAWEMFLPASLASLAFLFELFEISGGALKFSLSYVFMYFIVSVMIINNYTYIYLNQERPSLNAPRISEGIYRGIKANSRMDNIVGLQDDMLYFSSGKNTILAEGNLRSVYLMTDLKPCVPFVSNLNWKYAFKYFEERNTCPDLIVLMEDADRENRVNRFLDTNYNVLGYSTLYEEGDVVVYELKPR